MVLEKQDSAKVCPKRGQIIYWTQGPQTRYAFMCLYHQMLVRIRNFPLSKNSRNRARGVALVRFAHWLRSDFAKSLLFSAL